MKKRGCLRDNQSRHMLPFIFIFTCLTHLFSLLLLSLIMFRENQSKSFTSQQRKVPLINLSSDEDSDSENQKQNQTLYTTNSIKPIHRSNLLCQQINPSNKNMQFSTLSLDQNSLVEMDQQIKILSNEKNELAKNNEYLKRQNSKLKLELHSLSGSNLQQAIEKQYEGRLEECYEQIEQLKDKYKKLQEEYRKAQKKYQNRLINQELPTKKSINDENSRIHKEVTDRVKQICSRFLEELSKQKMNPKVQNIISEYVNELLQFTPLPTKTNVFGQYTSIKNVTPIRGSKITQSIRPQCDSKLNVSNDYRLLQKSIQKLKCIEKEIDSSNGTYLKKPVQKDEDSVYKSVCLDHSNISALDKSKSKRKRIFQ